MPPRSASRPMTFTGCWTCKARKVRCDERLVACRNCEKRGVECAGYGIRLQWVSDPLDQDEVPTKVQGRMRLKLDKSGGRYDSGMIDSFLASLDDDAESGLSARKGPFSAFPADARHVCGLDTSDELPINSSTGTISPMPDIRESSQSSPTEEVPRNDVQEPLPVDATLNTDVTNWWPSDSIDLSSTVTFDPEVLSIGASPPVDTLPEPFHTQMSPNQGTTPQSLTLWPGSPSLSTFTVDHRLPKHIHISLFGDAEVDSLISHYNIHIADLLQPIGHPGNPFRNLYLSTALEGTSLSKSDSATSTYSALSNSLAAASAFHMWNHNKNLIRYRELGARYRYNAIQSLQSAVREAGTGPAANYRALMITVLSLVTIGVLSGEDDDFQLHIDAATQLRSTRSRWKLVSRSTKQLHELGAFLSLLAGTLSFQPASSAWPGNIVSFEQDIIRSSGCYEYVYGVTPAIAAAIHQTSHLAGYLARFRGEQTPQECLPDDFLEACEDVGSLLESWRFESEYIASIPPTDPRFPMLAFQAKAWHAAALIYYYQRIQGVEATNLVQEVDRVAEYLNAAEDIKPISGTISMAPITWPGLIASFTALRSRRDVWRNWWERMLGYGIANNDRQWAIVQQVWEKMDQEEDQGRGVKDWTEAYGSLGVRVLPT